MAHELKDYDIMDIEAMDDERLEKSSSGKIFVTRVYIKDEVDAVLAEKDAEIARLKDKLQAAEKQTENLINSASSLMLGQDTANDKLDAENRRLKRALWLARAERAEANHAHWATIWFCDTAANLNINKSSVSQEPYKSNTFRNASEWRNMWYDIASKCRAKAEEYR